MTFDEFIIDAEKRFGITISVYKSKAGHEMVNLYMEKKFLCDGYITGPNAGYSCPYGKNYAITIFGWGYELDMITKEWRLVKDGMIGHRSGPNPFPEIPGDKTAMTSDDCRKAIEDIAAKNIAQFDEFFKKED